MSALSNAHVAIAETPTMRASLRVVMPKCWHSASDGAAGGGRSANGPGRGCLLDRSTPCLDHGGPGTSGPEPRPHGDKSVAHAK